MHLRFDDLQVVDVSSGDFSSSTTGSNYVEFYGPIAGGASKSAYVTLRATGVNAKIRYRGWLKTPEQAYCSVTGRYEDKNYRDPSDVQCRASFMDYATHVQPLNVFYYNVSLSPSTQSKNVSAGGQAVHTFVIKNEGNVADTFDLGTSRGVLSAYSVSLSAGSGTTFTLTDGSTTPGNYTVMITAVSRGDRTKNATATAVTTVVALPDLAVSSEDITFERVG